MTPNLKKLIEEMRSARENAMQGEWSTLDEQQEIHAVDFSDGTGDPFHICERVKGKGNTEFIILAANNITKLLTALELQSEALAKIEKMDLSEKAPDLIWLHNCRNNTKCAARDAQSAVEKLLE